MASVYSLLHFLLWFCCVFASAQNQPTITTTKFLRDPETITSTNGRFKIGFFSPDDSSTTRFLGIWYNINGDQFTNLDVVWVANRNNPLYDSSGVLKISTDGNLVLLNGESKTFWSSNVTANSSLVAKLDDNGNLLVPSTVNGGIAWQSFDHPANSWLQQMKLTIDKDTYAKQFKSWKSYNDPSDGRFAVGIDYRNSLAETIIWKGENPYWRSGPWNGNMFIGLPRLSTVALDGFSRTTDEQGRVVCYYSLAKPSALTHYILSFDGIISLKDWNDGNRSWEVGWTSHESDCDIYGKCGPFGSCNKTSTPICNCLKGFEPKNIEEWSKGNWSSGCVRKIALQCGLGKGKVDEFLGLKNMKVPYDVQWISANNQEDCGKHCLAICQCSAYAYYSGIGCMIFDNSLVDIQEFSVGGVDLFIRLASAELATSLAAPHKSKTILWKIILPVLIATGAITCVVMYILWRWTKHWRNGNIVVSMDKVDHDNLLNPKKSAIQFQDLPLFTFEKLVAATNNFQETNMLGRGGFGPVYKGELEDGQEIAVKRLARASGQGMQEFMNEVMVISKLQHVNLVRLLGCCVEGEEKMLVYEYMPNKSLNTLLFDPLYKGILDWKKRFNIVDGICRGLLYLHRDSRLRIIHRDLKPSNILLDEDLNPKISDFGMAKIFGRNDDQADTLRVVGTYGYMSPEYAMNGRFSEKSDVFSFGVLLLEIVSAKRSGKFEEDEGFGLLGYAWKLWNEGNVVQLIDPTVGDSCYEVDILRCIQLALLCVEEYPEDRPSVSSIISMLYCDIADLPRPKQPSFTQGRGKDVPSSGQKYNSLNHVSLTSVSGR